MTNIDSGNLHDLMAVVNSADIGLVIFNKHLSIRVWNLFMVQHSGLSVDAVMGKTLVELFPDNPTDWFEEKVRQCIERKQKILTTWQELPYFFKFKNTRSRSATAYMYQNITFIPLISANTQIDNVAITVSDVTDIASSTQQLDAVVNEYSQQ